jgi:hypothetical protein
MGVRMAFDEKVSSKEVEKFKSVLNDLKKGKNHLCPQLVESLFIGVVARLPASAITPNFTEDHTHVRTQDRRVSGYGGLQQ